MKVRLWALGNLEHNIKADKEAFDKLRDILTIIRDDTYCDIIWGPELEMSGQNDDGVISLDNSLDAIISMTEDKLKILQELRVSRKTRIGEQNG